MAIIIEMDSEASDTTESQPRGRFVPAGEFKTNCLRLMDEVNETGNEIIVTKHRRPVVSITPVRTDRPKLVGSCVDQLLILADIDSEPAIPPQDWDMIEHPDRLLDPERYQ